MKKRLIAASFFAILISAMWVYAWHWPWEKEAWTEDIGKPLEKAAETVKEKVIDPAGKAFTDFGKKIESSAVSSWQDVKKAADKAKNFAQDAAHDTKDFAVMVYEKKLKPFGEKINEYGKIFASMVKNWFKKKPRPEYCSFTNYNSQEAPTIDNDIVLKQDTEGFVPLIEKYSPIAWLQGAEDYSPTTFSTYMTAPGTSIISRKNDEVIIPKGQVTFEKVYDIYKNKEKYQDKDLAFDTAYCTLFGLDPDKNKNPDGTLGTPAYVVAYEAGDKIILQYMFFYGLNGPYDIGPLVGNVVDIQNYHESDLEHVTIELNKATKEPIRIYYGSHGTHEGFWLDWNNPDVEKEGSHPILYVAHYGHGLYPKVGTYVRIYGLANDVTGQGQKWKPKWIRLYPNTDPRFNPKTMGFMYFEGSYGRHGVGPMANQGWFMKSKEGDIGRPYTPDKWFCSNPPDRNEKDPIQALQIPIDEIKYGGCIATKIPNAIAPE